MMDFDSNDAVILTRREDAFNAVKGPRVGDFLRTPAGLLRFTHDWDDSLQTTVGPSHPCHGDASFYLGDGGYVSFSGSLDPSIIKSELRDTGESALGYFWFFHHNVQGAGRGVSFKIPCRIFEKRKFKVIDWTGSHQWLVEITGKDGSYSPILELERDGDGLAPTFNNQIFQAARLLETEGAKALENPHGATGRDCNCHECFCCAAAFVLHQANIF